MLFRSSHRKSTQVHASPGQTVSQVDPSFQLASTCESVWSGLYSLKFSLTTVTHSMDSPVLHWYRIALLALFHVSDSQPSCHGNRFLPGGFYFATGRNMVDNHRLFGYVFETLTVSMPVECFRKCQADCQCISLNYLTTASQENCELNEENKNTKPSALKPRDGGQYYDLIIDYNVVVSETKISYSGLHQVLMENVNN